MPRSSQPPEAAMLLPTLRGLIRLGWAQQMSPAALELPWHQKRIDIALLSSACGVIAVELKVSKWRKAIDQAYVNRWATDSSWVGVWHECITADSYKYAARAGVGMLAVTRDTVYPLVLPDRSPHRAASSRFEREIALGGLRLRDLLTYARGVKHALA